MIHVLKICHIKHIKHPGSDILSCHAMHLGVIKLQQLLQEFRNYEESKENCSQGLMIISACEVYSHNLPLEDYLIRILVSTTKNFMLELF